MTRYPVLTSGACPLELLGAEQTFGMYGRELILKIIGLVDGTRKCLLPWLSWNRNLQPLQQYLWSKGELDIIPDQNRIVSSASVMNFRKHDTKSIPRGCDSSRVAACDCGAIYWHLQHHMSMANAKAIFKRSQQNTKPILEMRQLDPLPRTCLKNICPGAVLPVEINGSADKTRERWWDCPAYKERRGCDPGPSASAVEQ